MGRTFIVNSNSPVGTYVQIHTMSRTDCKGRIVDTNGDRREVEVPNWCADGDSKFFVVTTDELTKIKKADATAAARKRWCN